MSIRTDFRDDSEVLRDHLRLLAQDILDEITLAEQDDAKAEALIGQIRSLAGAQLLQLDRFEQAEAKADAEAREWMTAKMGISDEEVDRLFPVETRGRLAPPTRRVFPHIVAVADAEPVAVAS